MDRRWLGLSVVFVVGCSTTDPGDRSMANLGVPSSPTADLLKQATQGQGPVDLSDPKENERRARMLPQVLANADRAIGRIQKGDDTDKVIHDFQAGNAAATK